MDNGRLELKIQLAACLFVGQVQVFPKKKNPLILKKTGSAKLQIRLESAGLGKAQDQRAPKGCGLSLLQPWFA